MTETTFDGLNGPIELRRLPEGHDPTLRAWDAADAYALDDVADHLNRNGSWLVVNDLFGALAVALASGCGEHQLQSWGDSVTSHEATVANLERNRIDTARVTIVPSTSVPTGPIDLAIIKIPRSLALLEDQLRLLRPLLHADSIVVGAGMTKTIHRSTIERFTSIIGPSPTSLAKRKARLIRASVGDRALRVDDGDRLLSYRLESGRVVCDYPSVFSRGKLDMGTGAFLAHMPAFPAGSSVLDLGCGNGLLGLHAAVRAEERGDPLDSVTFVDESYQAVASAQATAAKWALETTQRFIVARTLASIATQSVDIVLNNPPFHSHQSRTDVVAMAMFDDARRVLAPSGRLFVVGNRNLGYHRSLDRRFGHVETIGSTPKFVVLEAAEQPHGH